MGGIRDGSSVRVGMGQVRVGMESREGPGRGRIGVGRVVGWGGLGCQYYLLDPTETAAQTLEHLA